MPTEDHSAHSHESGTDRLGHDSHEHEHDHHGHAHAHGTGHAHAIAAERINLRMGFAVALNLIFVLIEGGFGFVSNSVALIADAGHNLSDVLGLVCAWAAMVLGRRAPGAKFTYGLGRSSVLAALVNAVLLLLACGAIAWEAASRLGSPPPVAGRTVMIVAGVGIVLNGISAWLLHAGSHGDLNRRSAYIHMLGDAAVSAGVLVSGLLIVLTGWSRLDPLVSLVIVAVILISTWRLLRDSLTLSLDGVPDSVSSSAVLSYLADQRGVTDVHDLHIWALSTTSVALTAHLVVPDPDAEDALLSSLTPDLKRRFHIHHATLQIERDRCEHGCEAEPAAL
ncbi:MAG TPA: cation diffusion facilitator family transporter [Steroidobacteraceae bacterium]|jgi:cobalt-zinc-cadmium efflux system protein|nr:cation diffusion facilitator family transporter [Steroidobacteraceae bacterium]